MATRSGTPALTILRTTVRRKSWNSFPSRLTILRVFAQEPGILDPFTRSMKAIAMARAMHRDHVARSSLTDLKADPHKPHQFPALSGFYNLFRKTSWSMCLSGVRSATSCLSFRFSSSGCRNRRSSATSMPANLRFHR
jgi:hypothetical protein